jgi:predicted molibdopterin-dependent oxidoreductase YjgC
MKITIKDNELEVKEGQTVLQAARENGIYIPSLCYHDKTGPAGKCRACVVEVEGMTGLHTACTLAVRDGMKIITDSEKVLEAQKLVVNLLLSTGKHDCLSCEQNGICELQDFAYYLGIETPAFQVAEIKPEIDDSSEFVYRDHSKCIQCGRCIAGCNGTVVNDVLDFGYRGHETKVICDNDLPMGNSSCVQCGECVQLCPTGAIIDKLGRGKGRSWETHKVQTTCGYCGVGCQINLHVKDNEVIEVTGVEGVGPSFGSLCVKGRYGYHFVNDPSRLQTPLIQTNGSFREASWDEVLDLVAKHLNRIKQESGPDAIGVFSSARITNEENYLVQKFVRAAIGTNNVDHCARL